MPYSFHEHTADIRMNVTGKTLEELFQDALLGMVEIMDPVRPQKMSIIKREIAIEAPDATALLIDFLNDVLTRMHTKREVYTNVQLQPMTERLLKAKLEGYEAETFSEDIKAVTYHEADVKKNSGGEWGTTIIFDI